MNRTTVPYQIKGGVKGGAFWILVHPKRPPLDPPLIWYGTVVRFIGTVGTVGTVGKRTKCALLSVPTVPTVPYQAYKAYQPYRTKRTKRSVPIL